MHRLFKITLIASLLASAAMLTGCGNMGDFSLAGMTFPTAPVDQHIPAGVTTKMHPETLYVAEGDTATARGEIFVCDSMGYGVPNAPVTLTKNNPLGDINGAAYIVVLANAGGYVNFTYRISSGQWSDTTVVTFWAYCDGHDGFADVTLRHGHP